MSADKPMRQITASDSSNELERAVLDEYMQAFKPEIELKLVLFNKHKKEILAKLFDDYNHTQPSERDKKIWLRIETIAYQYFARQILKLTVKSNADQVARYGAIASASKRARTKIEKLRYDDIARPEMGKWLDGIEELADATSNFLNCLYIAANFDRKIESSLESLVELEAAANRVADEVHKGSGRPEGGSILPHNYTSAFMEIYQESPNPTDNKRFANLIQQFLLAVGKEGETEEDYVFEAFKYQRKKARKKLG